MNKELYEQYQSKNIDNGICIFTDSTCPLKDHCNGLPRAICHKYCKCEEDHNVIDMTINSYLTAFDDTEFIQCMKDYFDNINYHSLMNNGTNNNLK